MVAAVALFIVAGLGAPGCSDQDAPLLSSARAGTPTVPLHPPLSADAVDDSAHEFY